MDFRLLGPLEARGDDGELPLGGHKQRALLAILLLHANSVVASERLVDLIWGDRPPATASKSVQVYVSRLRRLLAGDRGPRLLTRGPGYVLVAEPDEIDVLRFERLARDGRRCVDSGDAAAGAASLRDALALWHGAPLADFSYARLDGATVLVAPAALLLANLVAALPALTAARTRPAAVLRAE